MEKQNFEVKTIPRHTFFEIYDELSHRDRLQETNPTINIQEKHSVSQNPFIEKELSCKSTDKKSTLNIPPLNLKSYHQNLDKKNNSSVFIEDNRKKPPIELIAIEIPLKTDEINLDISASSRKSPMFYSNCNDSKYINSKCSEISNNSLCEPIKPASLQSNKSYTINSHLSPNYKSKKPSINELEPGYLEYRAKSQASNEIQNEKNREKVDKEEEGRNNQINNEIKDKIKDDLNDEINNKIDDEINNDVSLIKILEECKIVDFPIIINDIITECFKNNRKSEGCLLNCTRKVKINEEKRLEYLIHALGSTQLDITKLLHRNILRRYIYSITYDEIVQNPLQ